jgi:nicotinic acid mononucleotide adenylyltransferase
MNKPAKPPRTSSLKEFERFERAQEALEEALNPLQPLIEEYNAALEEVDGAVRARGISVGDFKIVREFDEYNADKLYELVGKDKFLELGGTESQIRKLSIDKTKLRSFIAAGKLPKAIVDQIQTRQRQYSTPKPLKLT